MVGGVPPDQAASWYELEFGLSVDMPDFLSTLDELGFLRRSGEPVDELAPPRPLRALAKRVGLSAHSGVAEYERGTRIPPADLIDAYERALALPSGYLMNLRQQILRERARSTNGDSSVLTSTPQELAITAPNYRLAMSVAALVAVTVTTAVIVARARHIGLSSGLLSGRVHVQVCVHSDPCSSE